MVRRIGLGMVAAVVAMIGVVTSAPVVRADDANGDIFYTTFNGTDRVFTRSYNFSAGTLTYGAQTVISSTTDGLTGADGLIFDPTSTGFLIVGSQGQDFFRVSTTPHLAVQDSGDASGLINANIFHVVADPSATSAWGSDIPGANLVNIALTGSGFGGTLVRSVNGADTTITGLAFDGLGHAYYTNAPAPGTGNFGTIDLTTGTTTRLLTGLPAAHGIQFDPYTGDLILFGDSHITQLNTVGGVVSDLDLSGRGLTLDQGTVDGHGHLFVASNSNNTMVFLDYHGSSLVGDGSNFLNLNTDFPASLDDVAPLVGPGSRQPTVPEPASLTLFGLGSLAAGFTRRRKLVNA